MPLDLAPLRDVPRLLIEAELRPLQGTRFQPTGFPNLGAARYTAFDRAGGDERHLREDILVESPQSMANLLEDICWQEAKNDWIEELASLPLVRVLDAQERPLTNSVLESHRLASSYILDAHAPDKSPYPFVSLLEESIKKSIAPNGPLSVPELAKFVVKHCPNTLIHGVFFSNNFHKDRIGQGRLRLPRLLSAFIEAHDAKTASSGGAKLDRQDASGKNDGGSAETGYGNVPFARDEYTAAKIVAYFNLDLAQLRAFGFSAELHDLIIALALLKIQRRLALGFHRRTACKLAVAGGPKYEVTTEGVKRRPVTVPSLSDLNREAMQGLIERARKKGGLGNGLTLMWTGPAKGKKSSKKDAEPADEGSED
jgi:CRISPR-associated protein Csb1